MNWFEKYLHKHSFNWLTMLPDGRRQWQASLDEAMKSGQYSWGQSWEGQEYPDELGDQFAAKKAAFFEWVDKMPGSLIYTLKDQIDNYMEQTQGFRPFETSKQETFDEIDTPSPDELEAWFS